jgi:hypothetical protein
MFDLSTVEVKPTYSPIPDGDYNLVCTASEIKQTKAKDGKYIKATFTVKDGKFENRKIFHMFNIENKNPQAVEIAFQELKKFLLAAKVQSGEMRFKDAADICTFMLNKSGAAKIVVDEDQNRIKYWKAETAKTTPVSTTSTGF